MGVFVPLDAATLHNSPSSKVALQCSNKSPSPNNDKGLDLDKLFLNLAGVLVSIDWFGKHSKNVA